MYSPLFWPSSSSWALSKPFYASDFYLTRGQQSDNLVTTVEKAVTYKTVSHLIRSHVWPVILDNLLWVRGQAKTMVKLTEEIMI